MSLLCHAFTHYYVVIFFKNQSMFTEIEFILYVENQEYSTAFYSKLLEIEPTLQVPGMTEFTLHHSCKLGLMPNSGIQKIIGTQTPPPQDGVGIPRAELYLKVNDMAGYLQRIAQMKIKVISEWQLRDWGDKVIYLADPDGHIIALAT